MKKYHHLSVPYPFIYVYGKCNIFKQRKELVKNRYISKEERSSLSRIPTHDPLATCNIPPTNPSCKRELKNKSGEYHQYTRDETLPTQNFQHHKNPNKNTYFHPRPPFLTKTEFDQHANQELQITWSYTFSKSTLRIRQCLLDFFSQVNQLLNCHHPIYQHSFVKLSRLVRGDEFVHHMPKSSGQNVSHHLVQGSYAGNITKIS